MHTNMDTVVVSGHSRLPIYSARPLNTHWSTMTVLASYIVYHKTYTTTSCIHQNSFVQQQQDANCGQLQRTSPMPRCRKTGKAACALCACATILGIPWLSASCPGPVTPRTSDTPEQPRHPGTTPTPRNNPDPPEQPRPPGPSQWRSQAQVEQHMPTVLRNVRKVSVRKHALLGGGLGASPRPQENFLI